MSETRVTITLGRTGQVVKRGGSKRFADGFLSETKRRRVDDDKWSRGGKKSDEFQITQDDLRLKLMRKRHAERLRKRDQSEKLLKPFHRPANANMLVHGHQPKGSRLLRQYPTKESLGDFHQGNSMQKYYSYQTKDGSRVRSPGRTISSSRRRSPPRTLYEVQQVPVARAADVSRAMGVFSNEVIHASRPRATATKPVASVGSIIPKSSLMGVDPFTVPGFLHSLGLRKYAINLQVEEVDMTALMQMSDKDLKDLGVPMGPRKKILLALHPRTKQQPS